MEPRGLGPHPAPSALGGLLKRRREALGLSMRDAAREIGISPSYLLALEHGRNPTTGRPPMPSLPILTALGRVLGIELGALLDVAGTQPSASAHLLLYQTGPVHQSPAGAARRLFADQIDAWVEVVDPRMPQEITTPDDILIRVDGPLGLIGSERPAYESGSALTTLAELLGKTPRVTGKPRLGLIFGANSRALRTIDNPLTLLGSEATWEHDVAATCRDALGVEPTANVCVYREADIQDLSPDLNPLTTALTLVQAHPHAAVQDPQGSVTTGPAAIEAILAAARPAATSADTWEALAGAAAIGLARRAAIAGPSPRENS